jgi:hypothetical protein
MRSIIFPSPVLKTTEEARLFLAGFWEIASEVLPRFSPGLEIEERKARIMAGSVTLESCVTVLPSRPPLLHP